MWTTNSDCWAKATTPNSAAITQKSALFSKLANGPALEWGGLKIAAQQGSAVPLGYGNLIEREILRRIFETQDAAEGMGAFAEKRKPTWQGK